MIYVMVTNWENHWDNLYQNSTYYTTRMLKGEMNESKLLSDTKTIFIKRDKGTRELEKAWIGEVSKLQKVAYVDNDRIRFKVRIEKEIDCPPKYTNYSEGWYIDEEELEEGVLEYPLDPPFFLELKSTNNWEEFEDGVFYLIRCLGIHEVHRFPKKDQRGKADGFFKFNNLAALYDCTLDSNFEKSKKIQIENFCDQLKKGKIEYGKRTIDVSRCNKNVWIITRGGEHRLIQQSDDVKVKEVPIEGIISLYRKRIIEDIDEESFEKGLQGL